MAIITITIVTVVTIQDIATTNTKLIITNCLLIKKLSVFFFIVFVESYFFNENIKIFS